MQTFLADSVGKQEPSTSDDFSSCSSGTSFTDSTRPYDSSSAASTANLDSSIEKKSCCSACLPTVGSWLLGKLAQDIERKEAWLLVTIVGVNFLSFCAGSMLAPVLPQHLTLKREQFKEEGVVHETEISIAFVLFAGASMIFSLVFGPLIPRFGVTKFYYPGLLVIGLTNIALGSLDYLPITSYRMYIFAQCAIRVVEGIGSAAFNTSSHSIIMKVFSRYIDEAFAVVEAAVAISFSLGPVLGSFLVRTFGWFWAFCLFGTFVLLCLPLSAFVFKSYGSFEQPDAVAIPQDSLLPIKVFFTWKGFFVAITLLVTTTAYSFVEPTLELFLETVVQTDNSTLFYFAQAAAFALSALAIAPFLASKSKMCTMMLGCLILAVGFLLLGPCKYIHLQPDKHYTMIAVMVVGFGFALAYVPTLDAFVDTAVNKLGYYKGPSTYGPISGLWNFFNGFGETFGPALAMFQTSPDFRDATIIVAAALISCFIIQLLIFGVVSAERRPDENEKKTLLNDKTSFIRRSSWSQV